MLSTTAKALLRVISGRFRWFRLIYRHSCPLDVGWRTDVGRGNIALGPHCHIEDFAVLDVTDGDAKSRISIGEGTLIRRKAQLLTWGGTVTVGSFCTINSNSILYGTGGIVLGNHVMIAANCVIVSSSHRFDTCERPIRKQGCDSKGIIIEDDVWIGANATILDGVHIGIGSVIGAGSVVTRDIPPYSVAAGVPARILRYRLQEPQKS